jgi:colanic acid/amylovoran biosynthesis glycosyltransferase
MTVKLQEATAKQIALIYAEPLLAPTMTFVRSQALALRAFTPVFASPLRLRDGLALPEDRVVTIRDDRRRAGPLIKSREVLLKVLGYDPVFFRKIARFSPVLVHAHFGPAALTALPLARWLKVPMVVTYHGYDATTADEYLRRSNYQNRVYARRKAELWNASNVFIAVSKFIRSRLLLQGLPDEKVVVHYIGVDTELFAPDSQVRREPMVLFVASLHEGKGCEYLIRAMARVQSNLPEVELVVIGDGPLRQQLEGMARESLRRFKFLGTQSPETVRLWMNRARVFSVASVSASSGWVEAFGLVYAEAQAMKLPVVSFASGGVPEVVCQGETGFLAPERDIEALAHFLHELLRDEALRTRMGENARRRVCKEFDLRNQTRRLEELYTHVLESSRRDFRSLKRWGDEREAPIAALESQGR